MTRDQAIERLLAHQGELRALGVVRAAVFGSTARGDAGVDSDVDVVVRLAPALRGFRHFGRIERVRERLEHIMRKRVDVVVEPVSKPSLRTAIEREAAVAF